MEDVWYTEMNTIEKLVVNLKILAGIGVGDRITVYQNAFVLQSPGVIQSFVRWWYRDSRWSTLSQIQNVINEANVHVENFMHASNKKEPIKPITNRDKFYAMELMSCVQVTPTGLRNLQKTYTEDRRFSASVDMLIKRCMFMSKSYDTFMVSKGLKPPAEVHVQVQQEPEPEPVNANANGGIRTPVSVSLPIAIPKKKKHRLI